MKTHPLKYLYIALFPALVMGAFALHQNKVFGYQLFGQKKKVTYELTLEQAKEVFEPAVKISQMGAWWMVSDASKPIGCFAHSAYYSPDVKGYNGKVPIVIALDNQLTIRKVIMLPNRETGDFVEILRKKNFFDSWNGHKIQEASTLKVDAITGATQTSEAIIKNVNNTLLGFAHTLDLEMEEGTESISNRNLLQYSAQALVFILALLSFFFPIHLRKYRVVLLALSVLVFGFWLSTMLTMATFYNWLINGFQLNNQIVLIIMLATGVLLPLFTGRNFYCQHICPFGCAQELCSKVPNKKIPLNTKHYQLLKKIRTTLLLIITFILLIGWNLDLSLWEPFLAFRINIASPIVLIIGAVFILLSIFINRPWCKYVCPTGLILSYFERK